MRKMALQLSFSLNPPESLMTSFSFFSSEDFSLLHACLRFLSEKRRKCISIEPSDAISAHASRGFTKKMERKERKGLSTRFLHNHTFFGVESRSKLNDNDLQRLYVFQPTVDFRSKPCIQQNCF